MRVTVTDDVGVAASALLVDGILAVAARQDRVVLCLSGGTSPDAVLRNLPGKLPSDVLRKVLLTWTDERVVAYDGPWSRWAPEVNRRAAHAAWLSHEAGDARELPLYPGSGSAEAAAAAVVERWAREHLAIDLLLLGFGADGHVASLFPGHRALDDTGIAAIVADSPKPPSVRVTLTLPTLRAAARTIGLCAGEEKAAVLRRASRGDDALPLGRYPPSAVEWVVDRAAAATLERT